MLEGKSFVIGRALLRDGSPETPSTVVAARVETCFRAVAPSPPIARPDSEPHGGRSPDMTASWVSAASDTIRSDGNLHKILLKK